MNIVVAEDEPSCLILLTQALEDIAGTIQTTPRLDCLLTLLNEDVGAVWLDLSLEDSEAENTVKAIPEIKRRSPKAALMVVSGWGEKFRDAALAAGANAYADKMELHGFTQKAVTALLTKAAFDAMEHGVSAQTILDAVAKYTRRVSETSLLSEATS